VIGLDTNVLVRFLVDDDDEQVPRARGLVRRAAGRGDRLYVGDVVLCETAWVLERAYGFGRRDIAWAIRQLLSSRQLAFRDTELLARALQAFEKGRGGFPDYVIREHALAAGCEAVATFDGALLREGRFRRV
jgi:predicted nucleic-acid-binding protein